MRHTLLWPTVIILSAFAAGLVNFLLPGTLGRPVIVMWFLFVCPGMMLIRFFQLKDPVAEWMLAIALSIAIDGAIAGIQMYSGHWSPSVTLAIIMDICIPGVIVQIIRSGTWRRQRSRSW
jgi:uncharacterized membrane protein